MICEVYLTFSRNHYLLLASMMQSFFNYLSFLDDFYWGYIGFGVLICTGAYLSYKTRFYQARVLRHLPATIKDLIAYSKKELPGVNPMRLYFASIGGMIGLGNIVVVVTALTIGGPGSLFWFWIAAFLGMIIKYTEIFLGMKYRKPNRQGGYDGGMMYCFERAFSKKTGIYLGKLVAILLCIYGVEIYVFTVITDTIENALPVKRELIIFPLLGLIFYIGLGGIKRLANLCSFLMPFFIFLYIVVCLWVIFANASLLPDFFYNVFKSAFTGHASLGAFAGSSLLLTAQQGAARAVYSGDIAIGFDSIIQSESKTNNPQQQARLAIVSTLTDAFIASLSVAVVYMTGLWHSPEGLLPSQLVAHSLGLYIPYANYIILFVILVTGFTTLQAYFNVGIKAAKYIYPKFGKIIYFLYAMVSFWTFAHYDQSKALIIMSLSGGFLILLNLACILKLRKEISFDILIKEDH